MREGGKEGVGNRRRDLNDVVFGEEIGDKVRVFPIIGNITKGEKRKRRRGGEGKMRRRKRKRRRRIPVGVGLNKGEDLRPSLLVVLEDLKRS